MAQHGRRGKGESAILLALASGKTVRDAAKEAGVGERTVHRRLHDSEFRVRLNEARAELIARAVGMLAEAASDAAGVLRRLSSTAQSETVRLGAARSILELGNRLRESAEVESRLCELERRANEQGDS